ncbi:MAG TPA: hypothetical protein VN693_05930 [Rhodanobacteraceae bacterium]|nr:hypothetical protein [Rhodanobacteraceae bacterium]
MNQILKLAVIAICILAESGCTTTPFKDVEPAAPLGHSLNEPLFNFQGTWKGTLDGFNAPFFIDSKGYPITFCIFMGAGKEATVFEPDKKGSWKIFGDLPFNAFHWGPQAVIASLASGGDKDGVWVEGSQFTMVRYDVNISIVYWLRTVNNIDLPKTAQYYYFAWGYSGRMQRVSTASKPACGAQ